jgi:hypothetical protein
MIPDVTGIWEGDRSWTDAYATRVELGHREIRDLYPIPVRTQIDQDAKLTITTQDRRTFAPPAEYTTRWIRTNSQISSKTGELFATDVSFISGQLQTVYKALSHIKLDTTPVSGFVDETGLVRLTFYSPNPWEDSVFIGRVGRTSRLVRYISGYLMYRRWSGVFTDTMAASQVGAGYNEYEQNYEDYWRPGWEWINNYFGTLNVYKPELGPYDYLSDRDDLAFVVDYGDVF